MSDLNTSLNDALIRLIKDYTGDTAVEIVSYNETEQSSGYCETCYYEETIMMVVYKNADGNLTNFVYNDDFGGLIRELTRQ